MVATLAAPIELPPGVPEACRHTYPICASVELAVLAQPGVDLHNAAVAQNALAQQVVPGLAEQRALEAAVKAQQIALITAPAAFVPIIGPSGSISQGQTAGPSGIVVHA